MAAGAVIRGVKPCPVKAEKDERSGGGAVTRQASGMTRSSLRPRASSLAPIAAEEPSAAGATVQVLRRALEDIVGVNVVAGALKKLPAKVREEFDPLTPMTWVPLSTTNMAVEYIAEEARRQPDELMDAAVRRSAEQIFRTSRRLLLRFTTDHALITRTPVLYSKWRNIGQLESRLLGPGNSEIVLRGWPGVSERNVRTLAVSIETVLRLAGRRAVRMDWTRTADGARYLAYWR